jgi:transposase-like protein
MAFKSRWTPEQKVAIVMESLNTNIPMAELCRKHNVIPNAFYDWKEKFHPGWQISSLIIWLSQE